MDHSYSSVLLDRAPSPTPPGKGFENHVGTWHAAWRMVDKKNLALGQDSLNDRLNSICSEFYMSHVTYSLNVFSFRNIKNNARARLEHLHSFKKSVESTKII